MKGFGNLLEGYRRFRDNRFEAERQRWRELAEGQSPRAIIIACCDSRADPATIFDTDPGEIFVVRNVGNMVPPCDDSGRSVADESGAAMPGVTVTISSPSLQVGQIVVVSEADGSYRVGELPARRIEQARFDVG